MMEKKNNEEDTEVEIIKAFRVFDTESNGLISNQNLAHIIRTLGETLTDKEIDMIYILQNKSFDYYLGSMWELYFRSLKLSNYL